MSNESAKEFRGGLGTLGSCLIEGDAEQKTRERRIRQRALTLSLLAQGAGLAVLLIAPFFARTASLAIAAVVPLPPYHRPAAMHGATPLAAQMAPANQLNFNAHAAPARIPQNISATDHDSMRGAAAEGLESLAYGNVAPCTTASGCVPLEGSSPAPPPPPETRLGVQTVRIANLAPAMLIHKVEPVYPPPARQLRISGTVVLHAIIATDGSVQSLEAISGQPLLIRSALEAVQQWRYRPTLLNGRPVQVDTFITVIYKFEN